MLQKPRKRAQVLDSSDALEVLTRQQSPAVRDAEISSIRSDLPFGDETETIEPSPEDNLRAAVTEVSGQEGQQGFVSIWKINENSKKLEYVARREVQDFLSAGGPDFLAKNFGPGDYEVRVYTADSRVFKRPKITISKAAADLVQRNAPVSNNGDIAALGKIVVDGFTQLGVMMAQQRQPVETRAQMLDDLVKMKTIFGGNNSGMDPLDMFAKMTGIFKSMQPRGEGEGNVFMELLDKFSPVIMDAMQKNQGQPALPNPDNAQLPPVARVGVALSAGATAAPALSPEQIGAQKMSLQLKMQLVYLCTQASRDSDPAPFAAIIVNDVPREALDAILNDANWLDSLAKFHPGIKQFPEWFNELREAVVDELAPEEEPAVEPENTLDLPNDANGGITP